MQLYVIPLLLVAEYYKITFMDIYKERDGEDRM
jgi:hypothetical protein